MPTNPRPTYPKPPAPPPPPAPRTGGTVGYFIGEGDLLRKGERLVPQRMWNCMCEGCGAPLQVNQVQCSYCLRATGVMPPPAMFFTTQHRISDAEVERIKRDWESGLKRSQIDDVRGFFEYVGRRITGMKTPRAT